MASEERKLIVRFSDQATSSLEEIWFWNASQHGQVHADEYVKFLRDQTNNLTDGYALCRVVPGRETHRYLIIKKSNSKSSHGHIAVFRIIGEIIEVIDHFHTAQDWPSQL